MATSSVFLQAKKSERLCTTDFRSISPSQFAPPSPKGGGGANSIMLVIDLFCLHFDLRFCGNIVQKKLYEEEKRVNFPGKCVNKVRKTSQHIFNVKVKISQYGNPIVSPL